jgi:hypothetical protein
MLDPVFDLLGTKKLELEFASGLWESGTAASRPFEIEDFTESSADVKEGNDCESDCRSGTDDSIGDTDDATGGTDDSIGGFSTDGSEVGDCGVKCTYVAVGTRDRSLKQNPVPGLAKFNLKWVI